MDQEVLLYDPAAVKFCALNGTAAFVWARLQSSRSVDSLLGDVASAFAVTNGDDVKRDLLAMLDELGRLSMIERAEDAPAVASASAESWPLDAQRSEYAPPRVRLISEEEVLSEFQVTSAGISWWVM